MHYPTVLSTLSGVCSQPLLHYPEPTNYDTGQHCGLLGAIRHITLWLSEGLTLRVSLAGIAEYR